MAHVMSTSICGTAKLSSANRAAPRVSPAQVRPSRPPESARMPDQSRSIAVSDHSLLTAQQIYMWPADHAWDALAERHARSPLIRVSSSPQATPCFVGFKPSSAMQLGVASEGDGFARLTAQTPAGAMLAFAERLTFAVAPLRICSSLV